ncbi:PREDICTED: G-type lectin S-receptor-like serine/threonine-protein kinase RLK1 [Tarenaya hassleriana]|uniref:G-type lectin S-receptor-like serine/threonine-protein kinase RLK1 n=1 Tax=Tarenaya hassleriana TaxID=28532 RepID=UPI00053C98D4|nr:PREDICTED: G-type lectin S-receptor-like serine/threonine-protein kinase RLK1 [Tarenaya hassleriana]
MARLFQTPILSLLVLLPLLVSSQNNGSVPLGSSLTAQEPSSTPWRSPSGDFALGFRKIEGNSDGFVLSIWFDKIPDKTIVWYATVDGGIVPEGSKVTLTADRGLVLTSPQGRQLWRSQVMTGSVSHAFMEDTGNFVLQNVDSEDLWSSFSDPTDTLLPTQIMELGGTVSSRRSETDFTKGRFQLRLLGDGNLVLNTISADTLANADTYAAYYISNTFDPQNSTNSGFRLMFNESGYMYILRRNNSTLGFIPVENLLPSKDYYYRAVLHFDGVFAQYYYPRQQTNDGNARSWSMLWSKPDNICAKLFGSDFAENEIGRQACGYNNVCTLGKERRPICKCPEKFSLVDPQDEYGDCKPDFDVQTCNGSEDEYELVSLQGTNFPTGDYERYRNYDEESCKSSCLKDCFCAAVIHGGNLCWKKKFPLSYGIHDPSGSGSAFIKVPIRGNFRRDEYVNFEAEGKKNRDGLIIGGSVLIGALAFVNFVLVYLYNKKKNDLRNPRCDAHAEVESNLRVFTYKELKEATREFKEELGRGAFGIVYKGAVKTAGVAISIVVAVKKLDRVVQESDKEFKNEVKVIAKTHHKNLVKLVGFCNEGQNRLIVYEFLPYGTLASFLFSRPRPNWRERRRMAMEIARGIVYLHEECNEQIVHCDIKPQNILLDEYYGAKISDFGLAKTLMMNQTHTQTNIRGTKGYVAPEWFRNSPITAKVDVYSFGVMILEIVCCKKAVDLEDNVILTDWVYDCFREDKLIDLIEEDVEAIQDMETVARYVRTSIWCIQEESGMRPNMRQVAHMLEGVSEVPVPPNPSPYYSAFHSIKE